MVAGEDLLLSMGWLGLAVARFHVRVLMRELRNFFYLMFFSIQFLLSITFRIEANFQHSVALLGAVWQEFNDFVGRCLEKKPDDRPSSRAILRVGLLRVVVRSCHTDVCQSCSRREAYSAKYSRGYALVATIRSVWMKNMLGIA